MRVPRGSGRNALSASGRLGVDLVVLAVLLVALALVPSVAGPGTTATLAVFGVAEAAAAFAAAGCLAWTGRRSGVPGWSRRSWQLLAAACLSWGLGQLVYGAQDLLGLRTEGTTAADGPFLGFSLLSVVSALVVLRGRARERAGLRALLDGLLLGTALLTVVWVGWLGEAVRLSPYPGTDLVLPLVYPVMDVVFVTLTIISVLRTGVTVPGVLCLAAACALTLADAAYFYGVLAEAGFTTGGLADLAWVLGFGLLAVGARYRRTMDRVHHAPAGSWVWFAPYVAMLPATVCGAVRLWTTSDRFVLTGMLSMVVLVMARQFLALADHRRLLAVAERQRRQLDVLAHVDPLTGLENRRRFSERIAQAVAGSLRTGVPVVVAFVDLDRFKAVNDTLGHAAGDDLLRGVAARLRTCVREADCAARWGGDEFAVLVTDPGAEVGAVADRLRQALSEPFRLAGAPYAATASVGVVREDPRRLLSTLPDAAPDPVPELVEALLAAADARMYAVKRARADRAVADHRADQ
ncbi:diguanylate cyclase domain-containing protein [Kineococcus sp. SYSU DK003]|uniref:diguanylate cyclase domain-containing protein n=1 Tax=Kineococcus sp. SYSU DK003 TaxID=3383124 RepID=UPI003D7DEAD0